MSVTTAVEPRIERRFLSVWSLGGVLAVAAIYGLTHSLLRLGFSSNLPIDDTEANVVAQTLELGYVVRQPPLYDWLLWSVQQFAGPALPGFLVLKYALLAGTIGFLYLAALRVTQSRQWAVFAGLTPLLLYQTGWNLHEGVTHTMALMFCVAASLWAFMRLVERDDMGGYLLFGFAVGLGLISKYNYVAFLFALGVGALLQPALRRRLFDPRILLSGLAAALVVSPFVYWLFAGGHDLFGVYGEAVAPDAQNDRLRVTLIGLGLALYAPIGFLLPLLVALPVLFPGMLREIRDTVRQGFSPSRALVQGPDWQQLLLHMTAASFLLLLALVLFTGANHILERYMHPFFLFTPLWLMAMAERGSAAHVRFRRLGLVLFTSIVLVLAVRSVKLAADMGEDCGKCRPAIPYAGLAAALKERGLAGGTIIAESRHDAGNLRALLPHARVVWLSSRSYVPPLALHEAGRPVTVIWQPDVRPRRFMPLAEDEAARLGASFASEPETVTVPWTPRGTDEVHEWEWLVLHSRPSS